MHKTITTYQSQIPTVPSHHFHDECPLMGSGCRDDGIDCFHNPVEGRVRPYGHVRTTKVIVNGTDHPDDVELRRFIFLLRSNSIGFDQFLKETFPFLLEQIGS